MNNKNVVDILSNVGVVKLEGGALGSRTQKQGVQSSDMSKRRLIRQEFEEHGNQTGLTAGHSSSSIVEQGQSPIDDSGISSSQPSCPPPICRQFWKAGSYDETLSSKTPHQNGTNYLHVHPMFLHSNATSHKWVFGAVAELLDNAVDEIQNGATYVVVDKISNPRDGCAALLIQDDGGGMDPQTVRHCMGFGFSEKRSETAIGRYGNGFKTSTMRLGADCVVFSRHMSKGTLTQSIGLLSYTFLSRTGHNRIVVPIVDYEFISSTSTFKPLHGKEHYQSNLDIMLQWSPYSSEEELLKQFDDIGPHGTRVIIYNLWFNNEGKLELDFDSDLEDILICDVKEGQSVHGRGSVNEKHIANRFHYSLRVYLSILYLRIPPSFRIILRGQVIEHHNVADDLQHLEFILYKPQSRGRVEGAIVTTIGFLKEAPQVHIHGFCVYHKNRLIMVLSSGNSRGRGVVGVLEANFVEPTHNKQEFERTPLLQKLENRLKDMTLEYWDYHCGLIGYQPIKKPRVSTSQPVVSDYTPNSNSQNRSLSSRLGSQTLNHPPGFQHPATSLPPGFQHPATSLPPGFQHPATSPPPGFQHPATRSSTQVSTMAGNPTPIRKVAYEQVILAKQIPESDEGQTSKRQDSECSAMQLKHPEVAGLIEENKRLKARELELKKSTEELSLKALRLRSELSDVNRQYRRLLGEFEVLDAIKEEKTG